VAFLALYERKTFLRKFSEHIVSTSPDHHQFQGNRALTYLERCRGYSFVKQRIRSHYSQRPCHLEILTCSMSFSRPGEIGKVYKLFTNVKKYQCERESL
jgi:hypothetical protein